MPDIDAFAVAVATLVAFVVSGAWYGALGGQLAALSGAYAHARASAATAAVEVARNLVLATVVAGLADTAGADGVGEGLLLGSALWVGFPVVLLAGSVFHERVPAALAAIHSADWLLKLLAVAGILAGWPN